MNPLSKSEVFEAANKLAAQGIMPSIMSIRKAIGDRGSESTILKYLRMWKMDLLKKSCAGCVFCEATASENAMLKAEALHYRHLLEGFRNVMTKMLERKPHAETQFAALEAMGTIQ